MKPYYDHAGITIYHGDCREILPRLPKVDLVLTDPPYGVGMEYGEGYEDSNDAAWQLVKWLVTDATNHSEVTVFPVGATCHLPEILSLRAPTWYFIWDKGSPGTRCKVGFNDWEICPVFGWRKDLTACHDMIRVRPKEFTNGHPCAKPIKLYTAFVSRCSNESDTVLDPFMGSGTTLRAAKDLGRKAIGIEIEERYCEIAARRLAQEVLAL